MSLSLLYFFRRRRLAGYHKAVNVQMLTNLTNLKFPTERSIKIKNSTTNSNFNLYHAYAVVNMLKRHVNAHRIQSRDFIMRCRVLRHEWQAEKGHNQCQRYEAFIKYPASCWCHLSDDKAALFDQINVENYIGLSKASSDLQQCWRTMYPWPRRMLVALALGY